MIKLVNLLKEINEAKQVGNLYHFTPLSNLKRILETRYIFSNEDGQVSTTRHADMNIKPLYSGTINFRGNLARIMLDGDKISTKYKIRPFSYDSMGKDLNLGEEQIVVNNDKFPFIPYLKRIDIFLQKKETVNPKILELLEKANIPYKIYQGIPASNTPYSQPKTGNPEDINIDSIPEKKIYSPSEMYFPGMKTKKIELYNSSFSKERDIPNQIEVGVSSEYPDYYLDIGFLSNKNLTEYFNLKGEKINVKFIPIPMYNDPKWQKMWKTNVDPPYNYFDKGHTNDSYILIPKNEV
jgi:hypothetical protein